MVGMLDQIEGGIAERVTPPPKLACRRMEHGDIRFVVDLLVEGFPERGGDYWTRALAVMATRSVPLDCPRFGYVLTADRAIVGVILLIFSTVDESDQPRCNISSWYVDPRYRSYASWLITAALKNKKVTYLNVSAAPHTRGTIVAQGFTCFARGVMLSLPALGSFRRGVAVRAVSPEATAFTGSRLLLEHARYGCVSVVCTESGKDYPFVFLRRRIPHTRIPCAQLIYCGDVADVARFAGALSARAWHADRDDRRQRTPERLGRSLSRRAFPEILQRARAAAPRRSRL